MTINLNRANRGRGCARESFIMCKVDPKEISLALSFLLPCPAATAIAALTLPTAHAPLRLPDEKPEPAHAPHGEGSGESPTFAGMSASGAMANVNATVTAMFWEPTIDAHTELGHRLFEKPVHQ